MLPTDGRLRVPIVTTTALALVAVAISVLSVSDEVYNTCYAVVTLGAGLLAIAGARQQDAGGRLVAMIVAAGLCASGAGDVAWAVLDWGGRAVGAVSSADAPYLVGTVLIGVALFVAVAVRGDRRLDIDAAVDALTVVVVTVLVLWDAQEHVAADAATTLQTVVLTTYPVLDAVILGLVVRLMWSPRRGSGGSMLVATGVVLWAFADLSYLLEFFTIDNTLLNLAWMGGSVLMACSTWATPGDHPPLRTAGPGAKILVAIVPLVVPPAIIAAHGVADLHKAGALAALLVLIALALIRTRRLLESEAGARRESEQARDAALAASRAKSDFLATISHEIRTPMNGVIGLTELLRTTDLDDRQLHYATGVATAARDLMAIIDDLLDFTKIEAGHVELVSVPLDVGRLLTDVTDLVLDPSRRRDVAIVIEGDVPPVSGDLGRLRQVLLNLVSNAVKFTAHGEVRVAASATPSVGDERDGSVEVLFEVTDTGIGISPEDLARVFDPFTQADASTTTQYGGTGLGLSISHRLVAAMGGTLRAESVPGKGSHFFFTVPLALVTAPRVLLVEDNDVNQMVAEAVLTHLGYQVLDDADPTDVDLVVADIGRAASLVCGRTPVLGLALGVTEAVRERAREAGVFEVLDRPFNPAQLDAAVQRAAVTCTVEPSSTTVPG